MKTQEELRKLRLLFCLPMQHPVAIDHGCNCPGITVPNELPRYNCPIHGADVLFELDNLEGWKEEVEFRNYCYRRELEEYSKMHRNPEDKIIESNNS